LHNPRRPVEREPRDHARSHLASGDFVADWRRVTAAAAVSVSLADLLLLQRSRGLFTGGFLSVDHLRGPMDIGLFVALSLLIDAAVAGAIAAVALFVLTRLGARRPAACAGACLAAIAPLAIADIVQYQLVRYLGTGFDLGLMFDLSGRSISEMWAVAAPNVLRLAILVGGAGAIAAGLVWAIHRRSAPVVLHVPRRMWLQPAVLALVAVAAFAAAVAASESLSNGLLRKPAGSVLRTVVGVATDLDRDESGLISRPPDPDPLNARVFPYAPDEPGNGIDEDGLAGDLPASAPRYPERASVNTGWQRHPDVVLIVLESFRADLLHATIGDRAITPVLNALAQRGASSSSAFSHNGYTVQSRFHLLAGTLIARPGAETLIDDFIRNGYSVGYFSGQDESFGSDEYRVGFDRAEVAYDARGDVARRYSTFSTPGSLAVPFEAVQDQVGQFVRQRSSDVRPMFLYVNFEDTHFPYSHAGIAALLSDVRLPREQITPERRDALWATYTNTVANIDRAIGGVIEMVHRTRGREPAVVVTADHGESLFEAGFLGHGYGLNDVQTKVPLIVVNLPMRVPEPFSQIDLRPALTEALRVPAEMSSVATVERTDRPVFQYLGDLRRPRQIAFFHEGERFIYDFRSGRVQPRGDSWTTVAHLSAAQREEFVRLVQQWEWMNLARRSERTAGE
jgi:arylsulfatase A-like enzyme